MTTVSEVIDSYVADVAAQLPRAQRADVAAELRSLLREEIGPSAGAADALARVRAFGRPSEVAARYHPPLVLVAPSDTRAFVTAAVAGVLLIPSTNRHLPISIDGNTALLMALAWLGTLTVLFAVKAWAQRRWPQAFAWKPSRIRDRDGAGLVPQLAIALLFAAMIAVYLAPGPALAALFGVDAVRFAYTSDFLEPLRQLGFPIMLSVCAVLHVVAGLRRRWTPAQRVLSICFLTSAGLQLGWHAAYGSVFADPAIDRIGRMALQNIGGILVLVACIDAYREWIRTPPASDAGAAMAR